MTGVYSLRVEETQKLRTSATQQKPGTGGISSIHEGHHLPSRYHPDIKPEAKARKAKKGSTWGAVRTRSHTHTHTHRPALATIPVPSPSPRFPHRPPIIAISSPSPPPLSRTLSGAPTISSYHPHIPNHFISGAIHFLNPGSPPAHHAWPHPCPSSCHGIRVLGGEGWHEEEQGIGRAEGGRE